MLYLVVVYMYYYDMTTYYLSMNGKKLNLSSLPITLKYGGMQGKIAESTFKSQRTRFLSSQPTDYQ